VNTLARNLALGALALLLLALACPSLAASYARSASRAQPQTHRPSAPLRTSWMNSPRDPALW